MGHNSMVLSHPKSTRIPQVDGLLTIPLDLGCYSYCTINLVFFVFLMFLFQYIY